MACPNCGGLSLGGTYGTVCLRRGNASVIPRAPDGCYTVPQLVDGSGVALAYDGSGNQVVPVLNSYDAQIFRRDASPLTVQVALSDPASSWFNETGKVWTISQLRFSLGTAPAGSGVTFSTYKNGVLLNTQTLGIGVSTVRVTGLSLVVADGDRLQTWITAVGSSTAGSHAALQAKGTLA